MNKIIYYLDEIFKTRQNIEALKLIIRDQKVVWTYINNFFLHSMLEIEGIFFQRYKS